MLVYRFTTSETAIVAHMRDTSDRLRIILVNQMLRAVGWRVQWQFAHVYIHSAY